MWTWPGTGIGLQDVPSDANGRTEKGRLSVRYVNCRIETRLKFLFFRRDPEPGPGLKAILPVRDASHPTIHPAPLGGIPQVRAHAAAIIIVATKP